MKTNKHTNISKETIISRKTADILNGNHPYSCKWVRVDIFGGYYAIIYDGTTIYAVSKAKEAKEIVGLLKGAFALGYMKGKHEDTSKNK